ncbi:putative hydro-lyase [Pseudooceanicola sp. GBMRC 2024]|uniref:Putative hydro-lyase GR170_08075 n=1 Tax=Pseudooceanicola albus TaxID=2692189 RepID=A0A6L7G2U7_9RHOB|nr:putative hydro-lyase [Pseudooceanicola albus]MXN17787.1 putative hydro-lyase [Pseudooceanicola albus]
MTHPDLTHPETLRAEIRAGRFKTMTSGVGGNALQANLAILPAEDAADFLRFCQMNPQPCPLLGVSEPGDPRLPVLGQSIDLRHDVPKYRVWEHGELVDEPHDIADVWREDLVAFAIGCSFSFEAALVEAGIVLRHQENDTVVPMYRTGLQTRPAGRFSGPVVVSMRPMLPRDAIEAVRICDRFPLAHGAPVHIGDPAQIGIRDLFDPEYGDAPEMRDGEVPVFWACGVTPQAAIAQARPAFAISHAPGYMLVTDIPAPQAQRRLASV